MCNIVHFVFLIMCFWDMHLIGCVYAAFLGWPIRASINKLPFKCIFFISSLNTNWDRAICCGSYWSGSAEHDLGWRTARRTTQYREHNASSPSFETTCVPINHRRLTIRRDWSPCSTLCRLDWGWATGLRTCPPRARWCRLVGLSILTVTSEIRKQHVNSCFYSWDVYLLLLSKNKKYLAQTNNKFYFSYKCWYIEQNIYLFVNIGKLVYILYEEVFSKTRSFVQSTFWDNDLWMKELW